MTLTDTERRNTQEEIPKTHLVAPMTDYKVKRGPKLTKGNILYDPFLE